MIKVIVLYDLNVLWLPFLQREGQAMGREGQQVFKAVYQEVTEHCGESEGTIV